MIINNNNKHNIVIMFVKCSVSILSLSLKLELLRSAAIQTILKFIRIIKKL
jgi:hypothetical protein